MREDGGVTDLLLDLGVGKDFVKFCGDLESAITDKLKQLVSAASLPPALQDLKKVAQLALAGSSKDNWKRARVAYLIENARNRCLLCTAVAEADVRAVEGRVRQIASILRASNVYLLTGGALEDYLPSFQVSGYEHSAEAKNKAVDNECRYLAAGAGADELAKRYGQLYEYISCLPAAKQVDYLAVIKSYAADIIHAIQQGVKAGRLQTLEQAAAEAKNRVSGSDHLFILEQFQVKDPTHEFVGKMRVIDRFGFGPRVVGFSEKTNAGMGDFDVAEAPSMPSANAH